MPARSWLDTLAEAFEADPAASGWGLWDQTHVMLLEAGVEPIRASLIAWRHPQLAILLVRRYQQWQAAELLRVSERTAKQDAQRVRRIVCSGALWQYHGQRVPRLRVPPEARVVVTVPAARGRRRR